MAEYLGEVIGESQAEEYLESRKRLGEPNYIMYLREFYPNSDVVKSTVIDARNYSGIARTINHSCEPNLFILPVRIQNSIPRAALFARRDIQGLEELSYDYNAGSSGNKTNDEKVKCLCGSNVCRGFLPDSF